jgi:hypothetical protein
VEDLDPEEINVLIDHPFGHVEVSLAEWMATGPGPRPLVRPIAARRRSTGEQLPLGVIPLRYRNDEQSRRRIAEGELESPW